MKLWRVVHQDHRQDAWNPPAMDHRWTTRRFRVTYACLEPGAAVAEVLSYVRDVDNLARRILAEASYDGPVGVLDDPQAGWNRFPFDASSQAAGDAWAEQGETAVLLVPSAILPTKNAVLNQEHKDFQLRRHRTWSLEKLLRGP